MHARLAGDLRVEGDYEHVLLARGDRVPVDRRENLDGVAVLGQPRRADEDRAHRPLDARDLEILLERADLAAEGVAPAERVHQPEMLAVEQDHPRAGPEHGRAGLDELADRLGEPLALDPERHRRRLPAGDHEPVEPVQVGGHADLAHLGAEVAQHLGVSFEIALKGEDAYQPRLARSWPSSSLRVSSELIAIPRPS